MENHHPKIRIENLIKIYGDKPSLALKMFREGKNRDAILEATGHVLGIADVSLSIERGELFVIMGLSGSGKSTLARCINRLIKATSGAIYIDGEDIVRVGEERMRQVRQEKVSMVFQRFGLFPHKTVVENVAYGLKVRGMEKSKRRQKALETLEVVGLAQWAKYRPSSLSGGMRQRVGLARALATDADILLMDEAFSALDPLIRREMQDELLRLQKELHKTIVFISHDIQEALKLGDRVAVMKEGAIVQVGTPEDIVTEPADDYIRAFVSDVNRARVLKVDSIARPTTPLVLERDSVETARQKMLRDELVQIYVVNEAGFPVGIIGDRDLNRAEEGETKHLSQVMQTKFPKVAASTVLENLLPLYERGIPVAVVDAEGKLAGIANFSDALERMVASS